MGTLLLFFDGIGVGTGDAATNPFAAIEPRCLAPLAGGRPMAGCTFRPIDATLGVAGLPQSATGQTTLLTGINAAAHAGRHMVGLPGPTLWPLLERESLFLKLVQAGRRPTFANAYTRTHLEDEKPRWSATTRAVLASGVPFRMIESEGDRGEALFHDYTGEWLRERGWDGPIRDAAEAAEILIGLADQNDLVLYEYFLTDLAGHRGSNVEKLGQARRVEALVSAVVKRLDPHRHRLIVTSDHGNLEEADHRRHTRNPVPLLVWGHEADRLSRTVDSLADITPALLENL